MILVCIKETLGNFNPSFQPSNLKGNKGLTYKGHSSFYILDKAEDKGEINIYNWIDRILIPTNTDYNKLGE